MAEAIGRHTGPPTRERGRAPNARRSFFGGVAAIAAIGLAVSTSTTSGAQEVEPELGTVTGDGKITLSMSVEPGQPVPLALIRKKAAKQFDAKGARGQGIDVALIDSGVTPVDGLHQPGKVIYGPDLSNEAGFPELANYDTFGHGTHLAGIINGDDGDQVLGIAPESRIVSLKVAGATGETHVAQVIAAIDWVVEHRNDNGLNIRVLNLSLGVPNIPTSAGDPLSAAVERAWNNGIVVVAAAGNRGNFIGGVDSPAVSPYVLSVGATEMYNSWGRGDKVPTWTSGGNAFRRPDVLAPGRSVMSFRVPGSYLDQAHPGAVVENDYFVGSGSSQSAAVQSGYVAALLSKNPSLTPDQVKYLFTRYAKDMIPGQIVDGEGKINPKATGRRFNKGHKAPVQNYPLAIQPGQGAPDGNTWTGGSWNGASWSGGSWSGASWSSASWSGASWSGASWSGASWSGASWSGASWSSVAWADAPLAATAAVVDTVEEAALDAVLEREDEILDVVALQDDDLVDQLLDNEDELHESLLTDNDAIVESILEDTSPAVDPTIVADVALVDAVVDIVTADISPVDQFVAQQAVIEMEVTP